MSISSRITALAIAAVGLFLGVGGWLAGMPSTETVAETAPAQADLPSGSYIDASGALVQPTPAPASTTSAPVAPTIDGRWLAKVTAATTIPARVLQAYAVAAVESVRTDPGCNLSWNTLAAIGFVESGNGTHGGASIDARGDLVGRIIGPALDGTNNTMAISDTDHGALDGDSRWDHAVGPFQFLPTTWEKFGTSAAGAAKADPNQIDDAALTAARYLCAGDRNLATPSGWNSAIHSYNDLDSYVDHVRSQADLYARESQ
jgi:membrane-bound lytic murein transglycosylase B